MSKRVLKKTFSEANDEIDDLNETDRSKRRKKKALRERGQCRVPAERRSAKFALGQFDKPHHFALFALTILVRALYSCVPELRDNASSGWSVSLGTKRIEQSALFRQLLKIKRCCFKNMRIYITESSHATHAYPSPGC